MCNAPQIFNGVEIACRKCSACKESRVDNVVGRCLAEQRTSLNTVVGTLTYGGDDRLNGNVPLEARYLDYRDITLYLKRLREWLPVRYVVAGEYGDRKGRGHWHIILFSQSEIPQVELGRKMYTGHTPWKSGFTFWGEATYEHMRYACSYVLKAVDERNEKLYGASRQPPLGREYFRQIAQQHVDQGLSPQDCFYSFPEVRKKDGSMKKFMLSRASARYYKQDFIDAWVHRFGHDRWPQSGMLDEYADERAAYLSLTVGDWLEARRWFMKQEAEHSWRESIATGGIMMAPGIIADRKIRAMSSDKLDDRLRTMGNRKGQGYQPETDKSGTWSQNKSSVPEPSGIRSIAAQAASTLVPPVRRDH